MKDHFTLEQKVGQLFVLGFQGYELDRETRMLIETIQPGGFLLFQRNIENFDQIYNLTSRLRDMAGTPGLLAIDHEGGRVDRLKQLFAPIPSMAELAEAGTASLRLGARIVPSGAGKPARPCSSSRGAPHRWRWHFALAGASRAASSGSACHPGKPWHGSSC